MSPGTALSSAALVAVVALVAAGCSSPPAADADDGAAEDAGVDAGRGDAGPWEPAFAPRLLEHHPEVECEPMPAHAYAGAPSSDPPGTLRWVYRPSRL